MAETQVKSFLMGAKQTEFHFCLGNLLRTIKSMGGMRASENLLKIMVKIAIFLLLQFEAEMREFLFVSMLSN